MIFNTLQNCRQYNNFWPFHKLERIQCVWQSRVEIEGYSVAYFDRIAAFEAPYR